MHLKGTITALITPFDAMGKVDAEGLRRNIGVQLRSGVSGLLVLGTTGEAPTLHKEERDLVIRVTLEEAQGAVPVLVGTGSYATHDAIEKTRRAEELGADAALVVTPYYNKPTQEGIYRHFEAVARSTRLPIVVYTIEGRCGRNIELSTLQRLAKLPNVVGVKEASGNMQQISETIAQLPGICVLSGDDALTLPAMALGARGVISVVSNLVPGDMVTLTQLALEGSFEEARKWHHRLSPLFRAAFIEVNPVAIKEAMHLCGMPAGAPRLPLCELLDENRARLKSTLELYGLL